MIDPISREHTSLHPCSLHKVGVRVRGSSYALLCDPCIYGSRQTRLAKEEVTWPGDLESQQESP